MTNLKTVYKRYQLRGFRCKAERQTRLVHRTYCGVQYTRFSFATDSRFAAAEPYERGCG